ncbi:MAG: VCBS repeat-containing protein, partial [Anaerolineae bacterium]|nr:VCBS repeat-containing protein [Anaerolineae bacterium]
MHKLQKLQVLLSICLSLTLLAVQAGTTTRKAAPAFSAPVLKWQRGGCYNSWCETGWYSSPATADLDDDGQVEVIASAYSIFVLNGETGMLEWKVSSGHDRSEPNASNVGRTWPGIVVADVDQDGDEEIVTAHGGGWVSVYTAQGYFEPNWPQRPSDHELRGLSASDLDGDGSLEIIVTGAVGNRTNTWIYEADGTLRPGWPQLSNDSGYAWGVYNANASVGDLDGDKHNEIVVPSDVHYICAYEANGMQIPTNEIYGGKAWGKVGVWERLETELRGWGQCNGVRVESFRTNFADGPSVIADVNGDDVNEVVVTGNTYDCSTDPYTSKYDGVFILNADRSRFNDGNFDWQTVPIDTGAPLAENYNLIESAQPNPAVADLDADGHLEIIYASYDGRVHAFWLDKSEQGSWPYSVTQPAEGFIRFASEPAIADLDNNGQAEVIFSSWTQKGSNHTGKLHILDYLGNPIYEVDLPAAFGGRDWNGALPAPTLANIDSDDNLE